MDFKTKILLVLAVIYNMIMGVAVAFTEDPLIILLFLCIDFFLIFYYLWLLIRQNYGYLKFEKVNKDLIDKARKEVKGGT